MSWTLPGLVPITGSVRTNGWAIDTRLAVLLLNLLLFPLRLTLQWVKKNSTNKTWEHKNYPRWPPTTNIATRVESGTFAIKNVEHVECFCLLAHHPSISHGEPDLEHPAPIMAIIAECAVFGLQRHIQPVCIRWWLLCWCDTFAIANDSPIRHRVFKRLSIQRSESLLWDFTCHCRCQQSSCSGSLHSRLETVLAFPQPGEHVRAHPMASNSAACSGRMCELSIAICVDGPTVCIVPRKPTLRWPHRSFLNEVHFIDRYLRARETKCTCGVSFAHASCVWGVFGRHLPR